VRRFIWTNRRDVVIAFFVFASFRFARAAGSVIHVDQRKLPIIVRLTSSLDVSKKASPVPNS
jgi:hypothetical protein